MCGVVTRAGVEGELEQPSRKTDRHTHEGPQTPSTKLLGNYTVVIKGTRMKVAHADVHHRVV